MKTDNYEVWRTDWRNRFLSMDHGALQRKLPFLEADGGKLVFQYFGSSYAADCATGFLSPLRDAPAMTLNEELNVYTLFWYAAADARIKHNWMPFYQLKSASPFAAAFQRSVIQPLADCFNGKEELLRQALLRMGGISGSGSDSHTDMEVRAFDCMPVRVLFWDGDDDFPAQANLLFDESATDFIHVESVVTIASSLLRRLILFSGLSPDPNAF